MSKRRLALVKHFFLGVLKGLRWDRSLRLKAWKSLRGWWFNTQDWGLRAVCTLQPGKICRYQGSVSYMATEARKKILRPIQNWCFQLRGDSFHNPYGCFPFINANKKDKYYRLIYKRDFEGFWAVHKKNDLDEGIKDGLNACWSTTQRIGYQ